MSGIYLIVALISQFSSENIFAKLASAPVQVYIAFDHPTDLGIGSRVVIEGEVVGSVTNVAESENSKQFQVQISLDPDTRDSLKLGTVALTFAPTTSEKSKQASVVELFVPKSNEKSLLKDGDEIRGFSSYEQFWSAGGSDFRLRPESLFNS